MWFIGLVSGFFIGWWCGVFCEERSWTRANEKRWLDMIERDLRR